MESCKQKLFSQPKAPYDLYFPPLHFDKINRQAALSVEHSNQVVIVNFSRFHLRPCGDSSKRRFEANKKFFFIILSESDRSKFSILIFFPLLLSIASCLPPTLSRIRHQLEATVDSHQTLNTIHDTQCMQFVDRKGFTVNAQVEIISFQSREKSRKMSEKLIIC